MIVAEEQPEEKLTLTWERMLRMIFHVFRTFDDPWFAGIGCQIAYYFFMASIPALIVLIQVLGVFDVSVDFLLEWVQSHMDAHMSNFVMGIFTQSESVAMSNIFMLILTIWAASGLEFSLSRLATHILTDGRYRYTFFTERLRSVPYAIVIISIVAGSLIVYVYGWWALIQIVDKVAILKVVYILKGPLLFAIFFVMVSLIYTILPRVRVPYRALVPGAIVATIGMVIVTFIFSTYVGRTMSYDILYGSFANIVALLLWFFLIAWVLSIGMVFNRSWDIYMARGRLSPKKIKEILMEQRGYKKNFNMYYTSNPGRFDRRTDTLANRLSRKYVPGYAEARDYCPDIYDNAPDRERNS